MTSIATNFVVHHRGHGDSKVTARVAYRRRLFSRQQSDSFRPKTNPADARPNFLSPRESITEWPFHRHWIRQVYQWMANRMFLTPSRYLEQSGSSQRRAVLRSVAHATRSRAIGRARRKYFPKSSINVPRKNRPLVPVLDAAGRPAPARCPVSRGYTFSSAGPIGRISVSARSRCLGGFDIHTPMPLIIRGRVRQSF